MRANIHPTRVSGDAHSPRDYACCRSHMRRIPAESLGRFAWLLISVHDGGEPPDMRPPI